ncbi:MAG TPA: hypothetical protein VEJ16_15450 [Alphaproteobacteria bacterium]|nr:hypothetical protein [Alphaproteobacteria bacterium]
MVEQSSAGPFVDPNDFVVVETCAGCGRQFTCCPAGECWCGREAVRLPLPAEGYDANCYCPTCLQKLAETGQK